MSKQDATQNEKHKISSGRRLLLDVGPLLIFFGVNHFQGIGPAIGVFIIVTVIALGLSWRLEGKLRPMPLIGAVLVLGFGGVSLLLDDEFYFKIKPTVVNLLFAAVLFYGWLCNKPILKSLFDSVIDLEERGWQLMTRNWMIFFVALAAANEVAWRSLSTDGWVTFKVVGLTAATFLFTVVQTPILIKYGRNLKQDENEGSSS